MSLAVLVDVGVVTVDVNSILGVLTVVAMTVSADQRLVAVAGSLPLVKTLGAPVGVRDAGSVLVVSVAAGGVVGDSGAVRGLGIPLVVTVAADGEAVAVVLGGVACAVTVVVVASDGTGRETEDDKLQQELPIL